MGHNAESQPWWWTTLFRNGESLCWCNGRLETGTTAKAHRGGHGTGYNKLPQPVPRRPILIVASVREIKARLKTNIFYSTRHKRLLGECVLKPVVQWFICCRKLGLQNSCPVLICKNIQNEVKQQQQQQQKPYT